MVLLIQDQEVIRTIHLVIRTEPHNLVLELVLEKLIILRDQEQKFIPHLDLEAIKFQCKWVKPLHLQCRIEIPNISTSEYFISASLSR